MEDHMKKLKYLTFTIASILILTGCSAQNTDLTYSRVFGENDIHVYKYSFEDGKAYLFDLTLTAPATSIANEIKIDNPFKQSGGRKNI